MYTLTLKRGDTLSVIVVRQDEDGNPLTGDASKLRSQIRDSNDQLVASFTITETVTAGEYLFEVPSTTTLNFPLGRLDWDIEYDSGTGYIKSTETMNIRVEKDVTRDEVLPS